MDTLKYKPTKVAPQGEKVQMRDKREMVQKEFDTTVRST